MPRATVDVSSTTRFPLETCPGDGTEEPGYVELRKLSYGQVLARRDMGAKMAVEGMGGRSSRVEDMKVTTEMIQQKVTEYEFKHAIAGHNLTDHTGRKLNFGNPRDIEALDPRVGAEIAKLIDDMNDWDQDLRGKDTTTSQQESEPVSS